jgi:hypothetical protein
MKKVINFIVELYHKVVGITLNAFREHADLAVSITERIKVILDSPIVDVITFIIPGDVDDNIVRNLRVILPIIFRKVALANNIIKENEFPTDIINEVLIYLKDVDKYKKSLFWILFSAELNRSLADGKITLNEAIILSQLVYNEKIKNKK